MVMINIKTVLIYGVLAFYPLVSIAELTDLEKKVIADYASMESMTADERRSFRKTIFANPDKMAQRKYNRAFKKVTEAGLMPQLTKLNNISSKSNGSPSKIAGTNITYDDGSSFPGFTAINSKTIGNRFDSALNPAGTSIEPVEASGSITMATFIMQAADGNVFFSVFDNINGTTANLVTSLVIPGTTSANTHTFASAVNYTGGPFIAGVWNFNTDNIAAGTGTLGGQGFHGVSINDISGTAYNATLTSGGMGLNALVRVSGNVATPVELLNFEIE